MSAYLIQNNEIMANIISYFQGLRNWHILLVGEAVRRCRFSSRIIAVAVTLLLFINVVITFIVPRTTRYLWQLHKSLFYLKLFEGRVFELR